VVRLDCHEPQRLLELMMRRGTKGSAATAAIVMAGVFSFAAALATTAVAPAAAQDVPHHPANLSLFYPIATNQDPTILTYFRLNLIYGRVGYIKGIDVGTIVNRTDRDFEGGQLTGVYSHTGGDMRGVTLTGGIAYVGGNARGIQVSGLVNFDRSWFRGVQYATYFNFVQGEVVGVQWASLFNLANADCRGLQLASFANLTAGDLRGFQIAGAVNYVNAFMRGVQVGALNFAVEYNGAQIGAINIASESRGAMIGIVNYARQIDAVPVGAINWDKTDGNADWSIYATNFSLANTGLRTVVGRFVSTVAVGIDDIDEERDDTAFLSWYYGYYFPLGTGETWRITPELGYVHVMPQSSEEGKINHLHFMIQARVTADVRLAKSARVFFGGGVSVRFSEYSAGADTKTDPLFVAGVALW
jgi:hypothetical protein